MNSKTITAANNASSFRQKKNCWLAIGLAIALAAAGGALAHYDLAVSGFYYNNGFYLRNAPFVKIVHNGVAPLAAALWLWSIWQYLRGKRGGAGLINAAQLKFLTVTLFWWSICFVQLVKAVFGRIRPSQASIFGGPFDFTPAFVVSGQCRSGCSFVSGHTGVMVWLIAFAMVLPAKCRPAAYAAAAICIALASWARIMGGFHYLSDIYFSIFFVGLGIFSARRRYL